MPAAARISASPSLAQVMPDGPAASCFAGDLQGLVTLEMRSPVYAMGAAALCHMRDIGIQHIQVEQERSVSSADFDRESAIRHPSKNRNRSRWSLGDAVVVKRRITARRCRAARHARPGAFSAPLGRSHIDPLFGYR